MSIKEINEEINQILKQDWYGIATTKRLAELAKMKRILLKLAEFRLMAGLKGVA